MRELKFRAWDSSHRKMIPFELIELPYNENVNLDGQFDGLISKGYIFMQYTNYKDKNNIEIYEGDIFSFVIFDYLDNTIPYISSVVFQQGSFGILIKNSYNEECFYELSYILSRYDEAKVIGNIYENPELLKGEKIDE